MPWQNPAAPSATTTGLALAACVAYGVHQYLERRVKGTLDHIHTNDTLYDREKYGHILDYDKHSLILHGQPTLILSGEFHYWRLPDQSRWRPILEQYRSAGLNCIRIYFHWGFHSPAQGKYIFKGNRDIDYLLTLCEEIGLYVLAAPGPYICAETQAGGFPIWLAAKRDIRLRHMKTNFWKEYDPQFMDYCVEYFENILPILAKHQITNDESGTGTGTGCVLALQIENESFQHVFGYPIGLHDDMRVLAKTARSCGITVPLFTNDGFEEGSFIVKDDPKRKKKDFGVDLYGFDKYVVFTPNSEPTSWVVGRDPSQLEEWSPSTVMSEMDSMEKKVRAFGHANSRTPIFIPELQGGWFNHYGIQYTYDAIYRFYGDQYTRLMLDTVVSQGCTMLNFYMFYGGTNWGTIGDADVYTSYDYSACIREFGLMSGRLRKLRLGLLFLQSFSDVMVRTDAISPKSHSVKSSLANTICQQRRSSGTSTSSSAELTFVRNFSSERLDRFELTLAPKTKKEAPTRLSCHLPYKASFVALGNYTTLNSDIHLLLSATPIHVRGHSGNKEVWIAALAEAGPTEMAFNGSIVLQESGVRSSSTSGIKLRTSAEDKDLHVLSIPEGTKSGHVVLASAQKSNSRPYLHIIFLDQKALMTLYCYYDNCHLERKDQEGTFNTTMASTPQLVTWGSYNALYNPHSQILTVDSTESESELHVLSFGASPSHVTGVNSTYGSGLQYQAYPLKGSETMKLDLKTTSLWVQMKEEGIYLDNWETRATDFQALKWKDCPRLSSSSDRFKYVAMDYHFTSGHVIYRGRFKTLEQQGSKADQQVWLKVNIRHRMTAYVNGICVGSHMVYSRQLLTPGAKMGLDPNIFGLGSHEILIPEEALAASTGRAQGLSRADRGHHDQEHEIVLVIDSFGLSRQPFVVDDIRNPRGLISARVRGKTVVKDTENWQISGIDVRTLDQACESTGFQDEHSESGWKKSLSMTGPVVQPSDGVTWWRTRFEGPPTTNQGAAVANIPLCCRMEGEYSAMIILNGVLVGRYFGSDSPQRDFYLMDGLIHKSESGQLNEIKVMIYGCTSTKERVGPLIRILPWVVEDAQGQLGNWSGNAMFSAMEQRDEKVSELRVGPFWTMRELFPVGNEI
ncbi:hypothetical protein BGZ82_002748 [Podila clonocystis]|nr:hypothetical protein BGZ82_002748 [Podila clonocystis]